MRETIFRLSDTSGALGPACGNGGVALAGVPLLKRGAGGFEARSRAKIETLVGHAYGEGIDATKLIAGLGVVAKSLNKGDLPLAMIAAVLLKLPDLDWDGAVRIAQADAMLAKFDPDQPRDSRGRWTDAGGSASPGGFAPKDIEPAQAWATPWWIDPFLLGSRVPAWIRTLPESIKQMPREKIPRMSGKESSDDIPSWARNSGVKPRIDEDGATFARRVMDDRWGRGNQDNIKEREKEFDKLHKYGDRSFRIPEDIVNQYGEII